MTDVQYLGEPANPDQIEQQFRAAMRRLSASVCIITIADAGTAQGMMVTSVSSLSTDPPSILACVNQNASMHAALADASMFCVNILHKSQIAIAQLFADKGRKAVRFIGDNWEFHNKGLPYLPGAQASLVCATRNRIKYATHTICIGEVIATRVREDVDPLTYADGRFGGIA